MSDRPACYDECAASLLDYMAKWGIEAHVTHVPPLVPPLYEPLDLRCPHGVLWFMEPTGEQIADWIENEVP